MGSTNMRICGTMGIAKTRIRCCTIVNHTFGASRVSWQIRSMAHQRCYFLRGSATMICRICLRFTVDLDRDGTCAKCTKEIERGKRTVILQRTSRNRGVPYMPDQTIMSRLDWLEYRRWIDAFMASVSDDEIDAYNEVQRKKNKGTARLEQIRKTTDDGSGYVYLIGSSIPNMYKIGKAMNVKVRIGQHMRDYPISMWFEHYIWVTNRHKAERYLLSLFADRKMQGEWFRLDSDSVAWIKSLDTDSLARMANKGAVSEASL